MLYLILILSVIIVIISSMNTFSIWLKPCAKSIPMKVELPGNLPIIALSNNGKVLNFLIDSGSNISHICKEYLQDIDAEMIGTYTQGEVTGLGGKNTGITMCSTTLKDTVGHNYKVKLSVSNQLMDVMKTIESSTGITIHGLLGTDFLQKYNYVIDFDSLEVYSKK